jgi:outer membrane receptor protein involved in Fe transport
MFIVALILTVHIPLHSYATSADTIKYNKSVELDEIVVKGKLTTQTKSGLSYNMAADKRAQSENALQSLSYVPLLNVDNDGAITVQGSSSYSLYLNGRPYEMAQTSPKKFLESLPASSIAKVEVMTKPDNSVGADANRYIINIVLKSPVVDGYTINLSGSGNTQPAATGSALAVVKKGNVDASVSYDYDLYGQRHQPLDITYTERDASATPVNIWQNKAKGNGDWHTHTIRAMFKWQMDSINTLYADAHGRIKQTNLKTRYVQSEIYPDTESPVIHINDQTRYTAGTSEANLIYRNYFRSEKNTERLLMGYHFTYNPDKRHITQSRYTAESVTPDYLQNTDGGMTEHAAIASYLWRISSLHNVRFTANETYRRGNTNSVYLHDGDDVSSLDSMKYRNNIAEIKAAYSGRIGKVRLTLVAKGDYDHMSMHLPLSQSLDYSRNRFYFLPQASISWRPNGDNSIYVDYSTSLNRPDVSQLNPFENESNDHALFHGNPNLKAQYTHDVTLTWYFTKVRNLTLVGSLSYMHLSDMILQYSYVRDSRMAYTYDNFGDANQYQFAFNANWQPNKWFSLFANGTVGKRFLRSADVDLSQDDLRASIFTQVNFLMPRHYRAGGNYGHFVNLPEPWSTVSSLNMYSFYVSKSFLQGRLSLKLTANSPFNKYNKMRVTTTLPTMFTEQNNFIIARSFGLSLSYSFSGGKRVSLRRDRTLNSTDLSTGVQ